MTDPRLVVVYRRTELEELVDRHGTRGQAEFFLTSRGRSLDEVQLVHERTYDAISLVAGSIPNSWRSAKVERSDLDRFLTDPEDIVAVVGQDGLVANVAKYLDGQPVVGIAPMPSVGVGVLVRHTAAAGATLVAKAADGAADTTNLAMVAAELDDGQRLVALNEIFVGHPSHQSARYRLAVGDDWERQSSSGLIVSTGTGRTGWCSSIMLERGLDPDRDPIAPDAPLLRWFVREAWPSPRTGVTATQGTLSEERLRLVVESEHLVVFGDGIETDRLHATWGQELQVGLSDRTLRLVV